MDINSLSWILITFYTVAALFWLLIIIWSVALYRKIKKIEKNNQDILKILIKIHEHNLTKK